MKNKTNSTSKSNQARSEADAAKLKADSARREADTAKKEADAARIEADSTRDFADPSVAEAEFVKQEAHKLQDESGQKNNPELQKLDDKADYVLNESKTAIDIAESARRKAELARNKAEEARGHAEEARSEAELARSASEDEREAIQRLKDEAVSARNSAEQAKDEAVSARNLAEQAKNIADKAEERYRLVLSGSGDGVFDWNIEENTVYWNGRLFEMLGLDKTISSQALEAMVELIHPDDRQNVQTAFQQALSNSNCFEEHFRLRHHQGHYIFCAARGRTSLNKEGKPVRLAGTITDITERKALEKQLEVAKETAELANQRKTKALSNLSHEFKNPLNAIIGYSAMMINEINGPLPKKQLKYAQNIQLSGNHMLQMVTDILDIARIESEKVELQPELVHLVSLTQEAMDLIKDLALKSKVQLHLDAQSDVGTAELDPLRVRQILLNLLSNAVKYSQKEGIVKIKVCKINTGADVLFEVIDQGVGIPPNKLEDIFTEFYQISTGEQPMGKEGGHGLGLPLSKRLAELHGGSITVESKPGKGSIFKLTLPTQFKSNL